MKSYKFFRKDMNKWIKADTEVWQWQAVYEDGTILKQFDDDGIFHQFAEIDQKKLAVFKMVSTKHKEIYTLLFSPEKMKLIHFYRNLILNAGTPLEKRLRMYCFGYEKRLGSKSQKVIMIITPDKGLVITEDPDAAVL